MSDMTEPRELFSYGIHDFPELDEISNGWVVEHEGAPAHRVIPDGDGVLWRWCKTTVQVSDVRPAHGGDNPCHACLNNDTSQAVAALLPTPQWLEKNHTVRAECLGCGERLPRLGVDGPLPTHQTTRGSELGESVECPGSNIFPAKGDGRDGVRRDALVERVKLTAGIDRKRQEMFGAKWKMRDLVSYYADRIILEEALREYWDAVLVQGTLREGLRLAVRNLVGASESDPAWATQAERAAARAFIRAAARGMDREREPKESGDILDDAMSTVWSEVIYS